MIVSLPLYQALFNDNSSDQRISRKLKEAGARLSPEIAISLAPPPGSCPDCGGPIARASGCVTCLGCGWGKCG